MLENPTYPVQAILRFELVTDQGSPFAVMKMALKQECRNLTVTWVRPPNGAYARGLKGKTLRFSAFETDDRGDVLVVGESVEVEMEDWEWGSVEELPIQWERGANPGERSSLGGEAPRVPGAEVIR